PVTTQGAATISASSVTTTQAPSADAKTSMDAAATEARSAIEVGSLRVLRDKRIITEEEYEQALRDVAGSRGLVSVEKAGWLGTLYGLVKSDFVYDTTQSFVDVPGGNSVARPGTFAGDHGRTTFSIRDSRFGFRIRGPQKGDVKVSGLL